MKMKNLKIKVAIGSEQPYYIDTNIAVPVEGKYYLPTCYKNPTQCFLVDYQTYGSVDNIIRVMAVIDIGKFNGDPNSIVLKDVSPQLLFSTEKKASQYYLDHKEELNFDYLKGEKYEIYRRK